MNKVVPGQLGKVNQPTISTCCLLCKVSPTRINSPHIIAL